MLFHFALFFKDRIRIALVKVGRDVFIDHNVQPAYTLSRELWGTIHDFQDSFPIEAKQ